MVLYIAGAAVLAAGGAFLYWQDNDLTVSRYDVEVEKLPEGFDGFKIIQLSDLHNKQFGKGQKRLVKKVRELSPDMIVLTGDLADKCRTKGNDFTAAKELCEELVKIAPCYAVMGNHETEKGRVKAMSKLLDKCGVEVMHNRVLRIEKGKDAISLIGICDIRENWDRYGKTEGNKAHAKKAEALCKKADTECRILLSHRPHLIDIYENCGAGIVMSGHAHGGQVRLPIVGGLFAPQQGVFPKYTNGVHRLKNTKLIISRGLGNSRFPFRVFNRPEIVSVSLKTFSKNS